MSQASLGLVGPAQSDLLVHFCGRPERTPHTPNVPPTIASTSPMMRLDQILGGEKLLGFPPFGAELDQPTICFSESPESHLVHLLERGWQPWGLLFNRQWVYDQGGAPVSYLRRARWEQRRREDKPWSVRLEADPTYGWSDWTHEREWRILLDPQQPHLTLTPQSLAGVLVADPLWQPTPVPCGYYIDAETGQLSDGSQPFDQPWLSLPQLWTSVPKWQWDPTTRKLLSPT
ncbi:hypothetical protein ACIBEF_08375 [Micromonospora sp. NPDC050795]|uniref:hypothetical protein n=1 Tax=Micromonospora sp. NPDC050795 TaxID=3364282 RepID=UPI00379584AB